MTTNNRPRGRNVCPRVNYTCANALATYLEYSMWDGEGDGPLPPSAEQLSIVASFLRNLKLELKVAEVYRSARKVEKAE